MEIFKRRETRLYMLFFAIMIIGIPSAYHRLIAFEAVVTHYVINIFFFLILASEFVTLKRLKSLIWVICLSNLMFSVLGYFLGSYKGNTADMRFMAAGQVFDPNDTAYVLLSLFPISFFLIQFKEGLIKKIISIATIIFSIIMILLTGSRGGFIGLLAVGAIILATKTVVIKKSYKIMFLTLIGVICILLSDRIDYTRFYGIIDIGEDYNVTDESGRLKIWERAIALSFENPISGVGVNCAPKAIGEMRAELGLPPQWHNVHNAYLQVATETGLIGFFVFILIIIYTLNTFIRTSKIKCFSREDKQMKAMGIFMLLGFTGNLVSAFFLSQSYSIYFTLYFALAACIEEILFKPIKAFHFRTFKMPSKNKA